jgi:hypothetical protein
LIGKDITISFYYAKVSGTVSSALVEIKYPTKEDDYTESNSIATEVFDTATNGIKTVTFTNLPSEIANGLQVGFEYTVIGDTSVRLAQVQLEE